MLVAPNCTRCPLSATRRQVVQPDLPPTMRVLFMGRDPGELEDKTGRPFHPDAPAGKLLRQLIGEVGIPADWCGFDNVVHCHTPKNRGPKADEVQACSIWRLPITRSIQERDNWASTPHITVILGQEAVEAYFNHKEYKPKKPMYKVGEVDVVDGVYLMPHPSAALRNGAMRRELRRRLRNLARDLGVAKPEPKYRPQEEDEWPYTHHLVAFDMENNIETGELLGCGLAWRDDKDGQIVGAWLDPDEKHILVNLAWEGDTFVAHSSKNDRAILEDQWGVKFKQRGGKVHDTLLMAHVLRRDQQVGGLGLKELALADLGLAWETMDDLGAPQDMEKAQLVHYCLCDCAATLMLAEEYMARLKRL